VNDNFLLPFQSRARKRSAWLRAASAAHREIGDAGREIMTGRPDRVNAHPTHLTRT
jgi:hypothetical protein